MIFLLNVNLVVAFTNPVTKFSPISKVIFATAEQEASAADIEESGDPSELIARRIVVEGDVQGGYYRSCVLNEVREFFVRAEYKHFSFPMMSHSLTFPSSLS